MWLRLVFLWGVANACSMVADAQDDDVRMSWSATSSNEAFIYVFVSNDTVDRQFTVIEDWECAEEVARWKQEVAHIHATFPKTGMYHNDGSYKPLWVLENQPAWTADTPTNDGRYLVSLYSDFDDFLIVNVTDSNGVTRSLHDLDILWPERILRVAAGKGPIDIERHQLNASEDSVVITTGHGDTVVVSLDDLRVTRSDALFNAVFGLFTSIQGIAVVSIFTAVTCGLLFALVRWLMGGFGSKRSGHDPR